MFLMALGACNFAMADDAVTSPTDSVLTIDEQQIKGNKDSFDKAVECMDKKDFQSAIVYLTAYISSKPKKYEAYKLRGDCFYALRQYVLAQKDYQSAIDIKTSDDKFVTNTKVIGAVVLGADKQEQLQNPELGNLYGKLMYAQKALNNPAYETSYSKAVEYNSHIYLPQPKKSDIAQINCPQKYGKVLNPQGVDEYIYGAVEDIEKQHFNEAVYKVQYLTSNYPKYYLGHYLMGVSLVGLDKENEAIDSFNNALANNPYDFESMASLGEIYFNNAEKTFNQTDSKKSIDYFNKALKYNPHCYLYYYYIGLNELQIGNTDLAINNFNKAIKFNINDYNSRYYRAIAQYIKGDYNSVIDECTRLLYRHVSNYNSVLYLRALAQYKLGNSEKAVADIEKIQTGVEDIYNADVRNISPKEKTLDNYLYYLKSKILKDQGFGVKADLLKALQNPIIAKLYQVENATSSYEKSLSGESISLSDYKNFDNFYKSRLPQILQGGLSISLDDIDNQYDYIRTTFDDLGISFVYTNPDYKMTTMDDFVYKKYSSKLSQEDRASLLAQVPQDVKQDVQEAKPLLTATTNQLDMLPNDSKPSIAQVLASQSLGAVITAAFDNNVQQLKADVVAIQPKPVATEQLPPVVSEILNEDNQPVVQKDEPKVVAKVEPNKTEASKVEDSVKKPESTKIVADEIKQTPDFTVSYKNVEPETKQAEDKIAQVQTSEILPAKNGAPSLKELDSKFGYPPKKEEKETSKYPQKPVVINQADLKGDVVTDPAKTGEPSLKELDSKFGYPEVKPQPKINEKHADVNPKDFDLIHNQAPQISDDDEIVELPPENYMTDVELALANKPYTLKNPTQVESGFSGLKVTQKDEPANSVVSQEDVKVAEVSKEEVEKEAPQVVLPEKSSNKLAKKEAVPVVLVPHLDAPKSDVEKTIETKEASIAEKSEVETEKAEQPQPTSQLALRPQVAIDEDVQTQDKADDITVEKLVDSKKLADKAEKDKIKADKLAAIELAKQQKIEEKEKIKAGKEAVKQAKLDAKNKLKAELQTKKEQEIADKLKAKEEAKQAKLDEKNAKLEKIAQLKAQKEADKNAKIEAKKDALAKKLEEKATAKQQQKEVKEQLLADKLAQKQAKVEAKAKQLEKVKFQKEQAKAEKIKSIEDKKVAAENAKQSAKLAKEQKLTEAKEAKQAAVLTKQEAKKAKKEQLLQLKAQRLEAQKEANARKIEAQTLAKQQKLEAKEKLQAQKDEAMKVKIAEKAKADAQKLSTVQSDSSEKEVKLKKEKKKFSLKEFFSKFKKQKAETPEVPEVETPQTQKIDGLRLKKEEVKSKEPKQKVQTEKPKQEENALEQSKETKNRFAKVSGDNSEVYVKTDRDKKIIKKLEQ